jgi:hypothetical protein
VALSVESISILNFFPPNRGVDFYFEFLPANLAAFLSVADRHPSSFIAPTIHRFIDRRMPILV